MLESWGFCEIRSECIGSIDSENQDCCQDDKTNCVNICNELKKLICNGITVKLISYDSNHSDKFLQERHKQGNRLQKDEHQ